MFINVTKTAGKIWLLAFLLLHISKCLKAKEIETELDEEGHSDNGDHNAQSSENSHHEQPEPPVILSNYTVTPDVPFTGDTLTIVCQFSELNTDISWFRNWFLIHNDVRINMTTNIRTQSVLYALTVKDLTMEDAGTYICKSNSNGRSQVQIIPLLIKPVTIIQTSNTDIVCDGNKVNLTCCTNDISIFNVQWKVTGGLSIIGTETLNSTCATYTVQANTSLCPSDKSGQKTNYTCDFQGRNGARSWKEIQVTYVRKANVEMKDPGLVSVQQPLVLSCQSDVPSFDKVIWSINTVDNIIDPIRFPHYETIENGSAISTLTVNHVTLDWSGTYYCTFYQSRTHSTGTVTLNVGHCRFQRRFKLIQFKQIKSAAIHSLLVAASNLIIIMTIQ
ncbi:hypothetical protein GDO86_010511 [Hymenochirus boettgeri]|uniref:Ig-like domain-containing protein n=1 Tax=Hymenochirus boettgeri TaxID=247094 RepID=A0A8T2JPR5_9PIPI|nr:hypothetical protein GDO86_010511 [Hymenochirus boettgeri]